MEQSTKELILRAGATLAAGAAVAGGYCLPGGETLLKYLATGFGFNFASDVLGGGYAILKARWVTGHDGVRNHDIQKAMYRAYGKALDDVLARYKAQGAGGQDTTKDQWSRIEAFVKGLKGVSEKVFAEGLDKAQADEELSGLLYGPEDEAMRMIWGRLDADVVEVLGASYNREFREFFCGSFIKELKFHFAEELKGDAPENVKAWRAFQRLLLEGLRAELASLRSGQGDLLILADESLKKMEALGEGQADILFLLGTRLDAVAEELRRLETAAHRVNPDEPFRAWLAGLVVSLGDELARRFDDLERKLGEGFTAIGATVRQESDRLSGEVWSLGEKADRNTERLSGEIGSIAERVAAKVEETVLRGVIREAQHRQRLPAAARDFTGREAELVELREALGHGGVTISGMGGVGKTALALKLANEFAGLYPDGQIYLDLMGMSPRPLTPAEIMWDVINTLDPKMKRPDAAALVGHYSSLLNRHRVLLCYDNAAGAEQVEPLLPPDGCLLLVTSRRHFGLPGMFNKSLDVMAPADAEALLLKIAPRIASDAAEIARQVGYLPLALRLAAGALNSSRSLGPADLLRRLRGEQNKQQRVNLIAASFDLSYELLSEELRGRWRSLAVFPAEFDAPAAAAVWEADLDAAKDVLAELEEYSLLEWDETSGRYGLHDLARDYADTHLSADEREQVQAQYALHYIEILATAEYLYRKGGESVAEGLALFDIERGNIEAGQAWAAARFDVNELSVQLCNYYPHAGESILSLREHPRDRIRWRETALHAAENMSDRISERRHLEHLGLAYAELGEARRALGYFEQGLEIARETGHRSSEGQLLGLLGAAYDELGEARHALGYFEQGLEIAREIGHRSSEGHLLGSLGNAHVHLGDARQAVGYYEQALKIARETGNRLSEGHLLGHLGAAYTHLGEARRALGYCEQALEIARETGNRRGEGDLIGYLGNVYLNLGEPGRAISSCEQGIEIARETGNRRAEGNYLGVLGRAYAHLGEALRAVGYYEQALEIARETGDRLVEDQCLGSLGDTYIKLGDVRRATGYYEQALEIARETGDRWREGRLLIKLGGVYIELRDARRTISYCEQGIEIAREKGNKLSEGQCLSYLGLAYTYLGEERQAIGYNEQALEIARALGDRLSEGHLLDRLGVAHTKLNDHRQALGYYEQGLEVARATGDMRSVVLHLGYLGVTCTQLDETRRAIDYYKEGVESANAIGDRQSVGLQLGYLGVAYADLGETDKAVNVMEPALKLLQEIGSPYAAIVRGRLEGLRGKEDFQDRFQRLAVACAKCGGRPLPMLMFQEGKIRTHNVKCMECHSETGFVMLKPDEPGIDIDDLARIWNEHNLNNDVGKSSDRDDHRP